MKVVFMGTPHAAVASLDRLMLDGHEVVGVYTQPDKPSGRGNKIAFSPVKRFAIDHELSVLQPSKIKTSEALAEFTALGAEVAVVVAYGRILPETFLKAFPMGAINLHFSLLPKYRGAAPVNWALVHGDQRTGVTTMQMDAGLDTGAILMQQETVIGDDEYAIELMQRLSSLGAEVLSETLTNYKSIIPRKQDDAPATPAPIMKKEDGLIDWNLSSRDISNRVRGFQPFPTSFTFLHGKKLTIWRSNVAELPPTLGSPGEIIEAVKDRFVVLCGEDSALEITELQLEGKRRVNARDFVNGVRPGVGELLGN
ncbi:MAG: methionyl-tRNA formyltransferase [Acidobacteriota bacterium]